jgi:hypothetical protein
VHASIFFTEIFFQPQLCDDKSDIVRYCARTMASDKTAPTPRVCRCPKCRSTKILVTLERFGATTFSCTECQASWTSDLIRRPERVH